MDKLEKLREYLRGKKRIAVAFSGGVDSSFLLKVAHEELGDNAVAITVMSDLFPAEELQAATGFCKTYGIKQIFLSSDIMENERFLSNPKDRCYICKRLIFSRIKNEASKHGHDIVADGTNYDDTGDYRPGLAALEEFGVISPLKELGFTKQEIRDYSEKIGLKYSRRQSSACLASRIAYGEKITLDKLRKIDKGEILLRSFGIDRTRVRIHGDIVRIETSQEYLETVIRNREEIIRQLKADGFKYITLDIEGFRSGSMNEVL